VIGQWQSTFSSPFWDFDGLYTNGMRTFNYWATGPDDDSTRARLNYYGPKSQGFIDFNRFPHAEEHENFNNMNASAVIPGAGPGSGQPVIAQDLNMGQDYVIRVDQFEAKYKYNLVGQPNKDPSWIAAGINIWDQREFGDRQANNTVHCYTAQLSVTPGQQNSCHVLSQAQAIDWNTFEVTPNLQARFGKVNMEFSHTLRVFSANDQTILGTYTDGGANILGTNVAPYSQYPYAVVPQSLFNMEKVKLGIDVNDHNHVYGYGYYGDVENMDVGTSRRVGGVDMRWTNTAFNGLNFTTYFKNYDQGGIRVTHFTSLDQTAGLTATQQAAELAQIRYPIGFNDFTAGEKFNWRPWTGNSDSFLGRLSFTGGYEFDYLIRSNENWYFPSLANAAPNFTPGPNIGILYQPNTTTNSMNIGVQVPWTDSIHTYVRYKLKLINNDLVGYTALNGAVNSNLPDLLNIIEFGADWFPSLNFGASAHQSFDLSSRLGGPLPVYGNPAILATTPGDVLNFGENSYNTSLVIWYRPTDKLTLTANSDYFSNQIKQNIIIGDDLSTSSTGAGPTFVSFAPFTSPWTYAGTALEFGGSVVYRFNPNLRFTADYEITIGNDLITSGGFVFSAGAPVTQTFIPLNGFSTVRNIMQQARAGLDWKPRERMTMYLRYQFVAFTDLQDSSNSGYLNMVLGGMNFSW